jgi:hypothetical protein
MIISKKRNILSTLASFHDKIKTNFKKLGIKGTSLA